MEQAVLDRCFGHLRPHHLDLPRDPVRHLVLAHLDLNRAKILADQASLDRHDSPESNIAAEFDLVCAYERLLKARVAVLDAAVHAAELYEAKLRDAKLHDA